MPDTPALAERHPLPWSAKQCGGAATICDANGMPVYFSPATIERIVVSVNRYSQAYPTYQPKGKA